MFGRPRRWSRLLFAGVISIALSVLAMHALAVDHALAAPASGGPYQSDHHAVAKGAEPHALPAEIDQAALTVSARGDACWPGCGADHDMSVAACLLALTLLVLCWRLAPPQQCGHPSASRLRRRTPLARTGHRRTLSLAELAIRRT